jgi:hypothetical protein
MGESRRQGWFAPPDFRAVNSSCHCERSEAIQLSYAQKKLDCFVAYAPRNDDRGTTG